MTLLLFLAIGLSIGAVSGTLGIGGGVLLVPALMWLCDFEPKKAAGTSLAVLSLPIVLPAAWKYYAERRIDVEAALVIAPAFAVGGYLGASLVQHLSDHTVRLGFGFLMLYIAMRLVLNSQSEVANAAAGLSAVFLAWLSYSGLRLLGCKHIVKPDLGEKIRALQQPGRGEIDYHI
jgi:uncharacterized membrane protein YfcA